MKYMDFFWVNPVFNFHTTLNSKHIVNFITFFTVYLSFILFNLVVNHSGVFQLVSQWFQKWMTNRSSVSRNTKCTAVQIYTQVRNFLFFLLASSYSSCARIACNVRPSTPRRRIQTRRERRKKKEMKEIKREWK